MTERGGRNNGEVNSVAPAGGLPTSGERDEKDDKRVIPTVLLVVTGSSTDNRVFKYRTSSSTYTLFVIH